MARVSNSGKSRPITGGRPAPVSSVVPGYSRDTKHAVMPAHRGRPNDMRHILDVRRVGDNHGHILSGKRFSMSTHPINRDGHIAVHTAREQIGDRRHRAKVR